jgi:hypothetical protein
VFPFPVLGNFSHTWIKVQPTIWRKHSEDPKNSIFHSLLFFSTVYHKHLIVFVSLSFSLSSQLRRLSDSILIFLLAVWPGNCFQAISWGTHRRYLTCLPCLMDHSPALPAVQYLKALFSYMFFWCSNYLWHDIKPFHSLSLISWSRNPKSSN